MKDVVKGFAGINQNYAWGQDSWRDFELAMKTLIPGAKASTKPQFPKLFSGQYGTEIPPSRSRENIVHSSFWGGDLEAFIGQASANGLFKRKGVRPNRRRNGGLSSRQEIPAGNHG